MWQSPTNNFIWKSVLIYFTVYLKPPRIRNEIGLNVVNWTPALLCSRNFMQPRPLSRQTNIHTHNTRGLQTTSVFSNSLYNKPYCPTLVVKLSSETPQQINDIHASPHQSDLQADTNCKKKLCKSHKKRSSLK